MRWTSSELGPIDPASLSEPQLILAYYRAPAATLAHRASHAPLSTGNTGERQAFLE